MKIFIGITIILNLIGLCINYIIKDSNGILVNGFCAVTLAILFIQYE